MNEVKAYESPMSPVAMMNDEKLLDRMIRFAEIMASGKSTIPAELRNPGDCMAITMQAMSWKMNPFAVAQKAFFIGGRIGFEAQLVAAAVINSGAIEGGFEFDWYGPWENVLGKFEIKRGDKGEYRVPGWTLKDEDGIGIKCSAQVKGERSPRVLDLLLCQARTRNSTLWADDPRQQLAYLAQKRWARLYTPGVLLGVYTPDELIDIPKEHVVQGEVIRGAEGPADTPSYSQKEFEANFPKWVEIIGKGKKTAEAIIAMVRTKGTLTTEQEAQIRAIKIDAQVTYAQVADALRTAGDVDTLDVKADLIRLIADDGQQAELTELYRALRAELEA